MTGRALLAVLVGALTVACERPAVVSADAGNSSATHPRAGEKPVVAGDARSGGGETRAAVDGGESTAAGPRDVPTVDRAVPAPAAIDRCRKQVAAGLRDVERTPMQKRAAPSLEVLAKGCAEVFGPLADAAKHGARQSRAERAGTLGASAAPFLPSECKVDAMTSAGSTIGAGCSAVRRLTIDERLRRDLDAGSLLYVAVLSDRAQSLGLWDDSLQRLVETFLLSSALEAGR